MIILISPGPKLKIHLLIIYLHFFGFSVGVDSTVPGQTGDARCSTKLTIKLCAVAIISQTLRFFCKWEKQKWVDPSITANDVIDLFFLASFVVYFCKWNSDKLSAQVFIKKCHFNYLTYWDRYWYSQDLGQYFQFYLFIYFLFICLLVTMIGNRWLYHFATEKVSLMRSNIIVWNRWKSTQRARSIRVNLNQETEI